MQYRVKNCVCGDTLRRIEYATRHPVLPRKSMHSLDVTHTNITFTRSSQTTDLSTNVNTTNTDSFTHKATNKTNKNPIRHFHTKHDKLKPSHERTTSRARLSGSKMEPTHRANNKSWRELVNRRRHAQYMKRKLEDQLIAPNKEHEFDCFRWASWNCPMTQTKLQHAKRTATQNMCSVCKKTETLKSETFDWRRLPTSQEPHMCQETRWRKTKTHPTRATPSGIQLIQGCHLVIPKTSTQTQLSRTPRMLRKKPQKVSGDVFHQKHQLLTYPSTDIPGFTHHTKTHATQTWKKTWNKRKERHATTRNAPSNPAKKNCCRSTQIWKQNWESCTSRDSCQNHDHTGCVVEHRADLLGKTWYKNWRLDTHRRYQCDKRSEIKSATRDPPPPSTQTHFHELIHRTTIVSWKNNSSGTHWKFSMCVK